jgi:hypothetical protein
MSARSKGQKRQAQANGEAARKELELRLTQLQQEDYVMPGWQTAFDDAAKRVMVLFQPCHVGMPEALTEAEFRMWLRGWDARRAAVMARRPRPERVPQGD